VSNVGVEAAYRRWLRWYPREFRREHADELLGVLLAETGPDRRGPRPVECLDLARGGLSMRLRPRVPRSDRAGFAVVRLMYLLAVAEFAVAVTIVGTTGAVRASMLASDPGFTAGQWHAQLADSVDPLVVSAGLGAIELAWLAWCSGRGRRWARALFVVNVALTTSSLVHGLAGGSATYAPVDLAVGTVLWLMELATLGVIVISEAQRLATSRSGAPVPAPDPALSQRPPAAPANKESPDVGRHDRAW
jgi:hypothetical protein